MAKPLDLRNEANAQYYFDEIKLWHAARRSHTVGIIVEAKSDEILFRKLLHPRNTFFAVDGHQNAFQILERCQKYALSGVFVLLDADFQRMDPTLEEGLILAYRLEDFVKTQLFQSLADWEKQHTPFKVHRMDSK